ncbi:MAG TPA: hypothetical protein VJ901_15500 [Thermoanaerobaculia bacterium]|nr:hypothetical protein [Thermoanaerobaculia bacterium]
MKNLSLAVILLVATLPLVPAPPNEALAVRIDIKPRMSRGIIPVRTMPYHATATVLEAGTSKVIGTVGLDLQPGQTIARTEEAGRYKIRFQSKIAANGLRAAAVATVSRGEQLVTQQTSDVSFER